MKIAPKEDNMEENKNTKWKFRFMINGEWVYATSVIGDLTDQEAPITAENNGKFGKKTIHFNMNQVQMWEQND